MSTLRIGDMVRTTSDIAPGTHIPQTRTGVIGGFGPVQSLTRGIPKGTIGRVVESFPSLLVSFDEPGVTGRPVSQSMLERVDANEAN